MVKTLVTGVSGFIGRNLAKYLAVRHPDWEIWGLDRNMDGFYIDLANEDMAVATIAKINPDIVVHLASSVSTAGSLVNPTETFRDTVRTAVNVLEACRKIGTPVIVTSSVKARDGRTPYGAAKQMVETWAREYMDCYGLPVVINRPGTVYGPDQEGSPESGWVAWFLKAARAGHRVTINGDGSQVRDLLYVEDYCHLIDHQINELGDYAGQTWDVGGGLRNAVTVKELADHLRLAYTFGPAREGDVHTYIGENKCPTWEPTTYWREKI